MYDEISDSLRTYNTVGISFQIQSLFQKRLRWGLYLLSNCYYVQLSCHSAAANSWWWCNVEYLLSWYLWRNWFWSRVGQCILIHSRELNFVVFQILEQILQFVIFVIPNTKYKKRRAFVQLYISTGWHTSHVEAKIFMYFVTETRIARTV